MRGQVLFSIVVLSGCSSKPQSPPERPIRLDAPAPVRKADTPQKPGAHDLVNEPSLTTINLPSVQPGKTETFRFGAESRPGWVAHLPQAYRSPALAYGAGKIYASGGFETVTFYAFDAGTGKPAWTSPVLEDNGPTAAVFDEGRLVFNTESCTLFTLNAETGKKIWHKYLGDPTLTQAAVGGGLVFSSHPGSGGMKLSAYQLSGGSQVWTQAIDGELLSAPIVAADSVFIATVKGTTYRFAARSGKPVWKVAAGATSAPWISGDTVYLTVRAGENEVPATMAVATGKLTPSDGELLASAADVPKDSSNGPAVWAFEGSRPAVVDGVRYQALGGWVEASEADTGHRLWGHRFAPGLRERTFGAVAVAGPQVVVATLKGELFGFDRRSGEVQWAYDLGEAISAQPVVARGWVYVTTKTGAVIGLDVAAPEVDGWHMWGGNPQHDGPLPSTAGAT